MESQNTVNLAYYNVSYWYPLFKSFSLKTRIIPTNLRFFNYLSSDGVYIHPKYRKPHSKDSLDTDQIEEIITKTSNPQGFEGISNRNNEDFSSNQEIFLEENTVFPEFDEKIMEILKEFDQKVFVKLNWKAPKDIDTWIPQLLCQNCEDIFMALKSSSIIGEMLENLFPKAESLKNDKDLEESGGLAIILKKWYDLNKALEFRVFVRSEEIVGISQRYAKNRYGFLQEAEYRGRIIERIEEFFNANLKGKFICKNYVFDVFLENRGDSWKSWLVDVNPWGNATNPLLFLWDELEKHEGKAEFRVVQEENTMVLEGNRGFCQVPHEFKGEISEENVKNWVESMGNKEFID